MQQEVLQLRARGKIIGLVPTMGYLHEGHLSLIRLAKQRADLVIVSIFVNPTQFGPTEDLSRYPRDFVRDEGLCQSQGADMVFYPTASDMYMPDHSVYVTEESLSSGLCGISRPTHFRGVATVVAKLFNLTLPHVAVFGEKDAQQLRIIKRMVRDLNFPITIIPGPIVREADGLAMSSRNVYLSPEEREQALCLRRALDRVEELFRQGERKTSKLLLAMQEVVVKASAAKVDYIELVDDETLKPMVEVNKPCLVAMAVYVGKTRLIDNTVLRPE
jgi:pantoate--beta-alanine ligase